MINTILITLNTIALIKLTVTDPTISSRMIRHLLGRKDYVSAVDFGFGFGLAFGFWLRSELLIIDGQSDHMKWWPGRVNAVDISMPSGDK